MAYRNFDYEKQYAAPDTSQAFAARVQGVSNLFAGIRARQEDKRKASDQFAYDLDKGSYENDTKILTEVAKNVTDRAKQELRKNGKLSPETERIMKDGLGWQQMSKNQMERTKALRQNIQDRRANDPYYNAETDENLIKEATHGDKNDVDFRTRGERLAQAENQIGGIDTFRFDKYAADYVKTIGAQYKDKETPLRAGGSMSKYNQATFWDDSKGVPEVTDKHAASFLESDHRVAEYYDDKINKSLDREIKAMKSSGDSRTAWMKGLDDAEIKNELINDPSKNLINSEDYGARIRNQAKADLKERDRINSKVSYSNIDSDKNNSGGRWKNNNILHDNAINSYAQEAKTPDGSMSAVVTYGPGGRFTQKSGKPIQIDTTNPIRTNIDKGLTTRNNKGNLKLNMTGYQLMPVRAGMAPFALKSSDPNGMIEEINKIPLEDFNPEGKIKLQPELKIGLNGYTINEAGVLNDIQNQLETISAKMNQVGDDKDKKAALENTEYNLNELKDMIGSGDYDEQDLIIAGNKAGVRKIQNNLIVPADNSDLSTIKNVTGGFDLKDKSYWSPEMIAVEDAYKKRYEEAKKKGFKDAAEEKKHTIKGKQYSSQAVEKAAKASGMTVEEYLNEVNK